MSQTTNLINLDVNGVTLAKPHEQLADQDAVPKSYITAQISNLIGLAPGNLDTLAEIADGINNNDTAITTITNAITTETAARVSAISAERTTRQDQITSQTATLTTSIATTLETERLAVNSDISDATAGLQTGITTLNNEQGAINDSISSEAAARADVVSLIRQEIDNEETARIAALASASTTLNTQVVNLNNAIATETTERETAVSTLSSDIFSETSARVAAVATLSSDISAEKTDREAAVDTLTNAIATETTERGAAVATLTTAIATEKTERGAAVATLTDDISSEAAARVAAIATEKSEREAAVVSMNGIITTEFDTLEGATNNLVNSLNTQFDTLTTAIATETTERGAAVATLTTAISAEKTDREAAVGALNTEIDQNAESHISAITSARAAKLDRSNKYSKRYDSNFSVAENEAYLYIGEGWRIAAGNSDNRKKLTFEYSTDGINWTLGLPFIKDIVTSPLDLMFGQLPTNSGIAGIWSVNMHMLGATPVAELRTKIPHAYKVIETTPESQVMSLNTYDSQACSFRMSISNYDSTNFADTNQKGCDVAITSVNLPNSWPNQWRSHDDLSVVLPANGNTFQLRNITVTSEKTFEGILVYTANNDNPTPSQLVNKFLGFSVDAEGEQNYITLGTSSTAAKVCFNFV